MKKVYLLGLQLCLLLCYSCETDHEEAYGYYGFEYQADQYTDYGENPFVEVTDQAVSTFSIDADGASLSNTRRFIRQDGQLPPVAAVRTEEFINYFPLDYAYDDPSHPIKINGEVSSCPWNEEHKLIRIGIKGKPVSREELPPSNFVFLIDVSGSMSSDDKLGLLKKGFTRFVDEMRDQDRIAIVSYAGADRIVLHATDGTQKEIIKSAIRNLESGGGTAGAAGINTAYEIATQNFIEDGNNRIILGTDGDFNVGISSQEELVTLIEAQREKGIFLSVLGVGRGNLNDSSMEQIANHGNGTYEYIDSEAQLKKVFIEDFGHFYAVAKDVKVQIAFEARNVKSYRLIGYENRVLSEDEFDDDTKDAGEIGVNQNVTALYEIIPASNPNYESLPSFSIDFRYKQPDSDNSTAMNLEVFDKLNSFESSSSFMQFTSAVAAYSLLITDSKYIQNTSYEAIINWIDQSEIEDINGHVSDFRTLVQQTDAID